MNLCGKIIIAYVIREGPDVLIRRGEGIGKYTKEKDMGRQEQKVEQCCYKHRNAWGHQIT